MDEDSEQLDRRSLRTLALVTGGLGAGALAMVLAARSIKPPPVPLPPVLEAPIVRYSPAGGVFACIVVDRWSMIVDVESKVMARLRASRRLYCGHDVPPQESDPGSLEVAAVARATADGVAMGLLGLRVLPSQG
jgi:hypothetical protein